jgi:hypothetical protein
MKRIVLFISILFSFGLSTYAEPCAPGEEFCRGRCRPQAACTKGGPPPPGLVLPIDSNIYFLLTAGLGLGVYFLGFAGKKFPASYSPSSE